MKQKIVIKVQINCEKCRRKAMQLAVAQGVVDSLAVEGENRDELVLVGNDIDITRLTSKLRSKVGHAKIEKVEQVKPAKAEPKPAVPPAVQWYTSYPPCPQVVYCDNYASTDSNCTIM